VAPVVKSVALTLGALAALAAMVIVGLATVGSGARPGVPLLGQAGARPSVAVLTEGSTLALPPSTADNRFDVGWEPRHAASGQVVLAPVPVPANAGSRLLVVHLGEEVERTLSLDLAPGSPPVAGRLRIHSGDRELATAPLTGTAPLLRVRLPADLPVGEVPLDLVFDGRAAAVTGAAIAPALPPGSARIEGHDLVQAGNCLVYLPCRLTGDEALVGTFVPPAGARPGQRFDLAVERLDGTPIRRFSWQPSFWNRLRGARSFELPLRGSQGDMRVRLLSRAGPAGGPAGRWQGLSLASVRGEILTPGQGQ
jgi:hypothetical protein